MRGASQHPSDAATTASSSFTADGFSILAMICGPHAHAPTVTGARRPVEGGPR